MDREQLKKLIQEVYDDYDFAEFNLHFVNVVEPGKVYEIKNNRINNVLKNTTLIYASFMVSKYQIESMKLYDMNVKEHVVKRMIEDTADKILTDIYKVENKDWFYNFWKCVSFNDIWWSKWFCEKICLSNAEYYKIRGDNLWIMIE